jgi:hypothetical protein
MLVACRLAGLSALVFDYAVGGAGAQSVHDKGFGGPRRILGVNSVASDQRRRQ